MTDTSLQLISTCWNSTLMRPELKTRRLGFWMWF